MKNQSGTIKTNLELDRVVMGGSGGYRRLPGGSDHFSWQTAPIIYKSSPSSSLLHYIKSRIEFKITPLSGWFWSGSDVRLGSRNGKVEKQIQQKLIQLEKRSPEHGARPAALETPSLIIGSLRWILPKTDQRFSTQCTGVSTAQIEIARSVRLASFHLLFIRSIGWRWNRL